MEELKGYWQYSGIYIPNAVYKIPCIDQANYITREGQIISDYVNTIIVSFKPNLNIEEYRKKYSVFRNDKWFYVKPAKTQYEQMLIKEQSLLA